MARFSQNTLTQVAGIDGQILAQELVYLQKDFWSMEWTTIDLNGNTVPVDLTNVDIDAQIIRRKISNLEDTRTGLSFDISNYPGEVNVIPLTISNRTDTQGKFVLSFDDESWGILETDAELDIDVQNPVCFTGRIKLSFPVVGNQPAYDEQIFLMFLIRNNGINL